MKKLIITIFMLFLFCSGCATNEAASAVRHYLDKFNNQDTEVLKELDTLLEKENLTDEQKKIYKDIMLKQYTDLRYIIVDEKYNGDEAIVVTKITVYDLYGVQKDAQDYLKDHEQEFLDANKNYDANLFLDYKLKEMKKVTTKVDYTLEFKIRKIDGTWVLENPTTADLEKIHGIYNYTND